MSFLSGVNSRVLMRTKVLSVMVSFSMRSAASRGEAPAAAALPPRATSDLVRSFCEMGYGESQMNGGGLTLEASPGFLLEAAAMF